MTITIFNKNTNIFNKNTNFSFYVEEENVFDFLEFQKNTFIPFIETQEKFILKTIENFNDKETMEYINNCTLCCKDLEKDKIKIENSSLKEKIINNYLIPVLKSNVFLDEIKSFSFIFLHYFLLDIVDILNRKKINFSLDCNNEILICSPESYIYNDIFGELNKEKHFETIKNFVLIKNNFSKENKRKSSFELIDKFYNVKYTTIINLFDSVVTNSLENLVFFNENNIILKNNFFTF